MTVLFPLQSKKGRKLVCKILVFRISSNKEGSVEHFQITNVRFYRLFNVAFGKKTVSQQIQSNNNNNYVSVKKITRRG